MADYTLFKWGFDLTFVPDTADYFSCNYRETGAVFVESYLASVLAFFQKRCLFCPKTGQSRFSLYSRPDLILLIQTFVKLEISAEPVIFVPRILLDAPQHRKISKSNLFFVLPCFLSNEFLSKFPERKPNENRYGECPGGQRCDPQNLSNAFAFFSFPRLTDRLFESFGSCSPIHKKAAGIFSCTGCILPRQIKIAVLV